MQSQAALLIGDITHARKEWEDFASFLTLKVRSHRICLSTEARWKKTGELFRKEREGNGVKKQKISAALKLEKCAKKRRKNAGKLSEEKH